jgi:hypothetical protein
MIDEVNLEEWGFIVILFNYILKQLKHIDLLDKIREAVLWTYIVKIVKIVELRSRSGLRRHGFGSVLELHKNGSPVNQARNLPRVDQG